MNMWLFFRVSTNSEANFGVDDSVCEIAGNRGFFFHYAAPVCLSSSPPTVRRPVLCLWSAKILRLTESLSLAWRVSNSRSGSFCVDAAFSVCSSSLSTGSAEGKRGHIQLPLHDDGEEELDGGTSQNDPFPITKPVDMLDGYPIREDDFWREVRSSRV